MSDAALEPPKAAEGGLVRLIVLGALLLVPIRILGEGYLPPDDALRHAGKAVSGRDWSEILVLRPGITMDSHPGWHAILRSVHLATGAGAHTLVLASVVGLFLAFSAPAVILLERPEAWLVALAAVNIADPRLVARMLLGRPFIVTAALLSVVCLVWPRLASPRTDRSALAMLTGLVAAAVWVHGNWYLLLLPALSFFLASQWRAGVRLLACLAAGILLGALATGRPIAFLAQAVLHGYLALGQPVSAATIAIEFRPSSGSPLVVAGLLGLLAWRAARGRPNRDLPRDPVFVLAVAGWVLGFVSIRFFSDWAVPALLVFAAREIGDALPGAGAPGGRRLAAALAGAVLFLSLSADVDARWSAEERFLALDNPLHAPWLPDPGGILYSADMGVFYRTFFRNPAAPWRYVLGFEPGLMPEPDLEVYRKVMKSSGATESFLPWVAKMKPADRLLIRITSNQPPPVPGLEWYQVEFSTWSGRLPRGPVSPAARPGAER